MRKINLLIAVMAPVMSMNAQDSERPLAFPGAEGFGKYTTGGRGGNVVYVTNLEDDGEGSLRWAVKKKGPKTILFNVSGTIHLKKTLDLNRDSMTIAGQSAPGDGICIANAPVKVKGNNIILRYLRFRMGDENKLEDDALTIRDAKDVIIDHCSASWSTDETLTAYGVENFTLQWCMITESLYNSAHRKGTHGYGGIWGGKNASFHHNLLAHHDSRNPRFDHPGISNLAGVIDFRNNVIYNWGKNISYGGETRTINLIGNYYKPGPAMAKNKNTYFFNPMNQTKKEEAPQGYGTFFIAGNIMEGNAQINRDNKTGIKPQNPVAIEELLVNTPYPDGGVTTQPAVVAYEAVLKEVGASFRRDAVDARILEEVKAGTATFGRTYGGGKKGIIDSQVEVGGWPELKSHPALVDSDQDGMPDEWEKLHGLNPKDKKDGNAVTLRPPYTNLEVYLNSILEK